MANTIKIGEFEVGDGMPARVIAEIGINHNGSLNIAKKMIDIAQDCGADIVKFQKRDLSTLYRKDVLEDPNREGQSLQFLIPILKEVELSDAAYKEIAEYCKQRGIMFMCTPFDRRSVDFLETLGVLAYKVASADLCNFELLEHIASKKKPMIVSTGMSNMDEIEATAKFLAGLDANFMLMHCNSTYPAPFHDINLRFIQVLKERYNVPVGYSGHERGILISAVAVAMGACMVERHITLDRTMPGPDHAASIEPQGLSRMIQDIRNVELALGMPAKRFTRGEGLMRENLGKSIVAACNIKKGQAITREMLTAKSPGKGISPQRMGEIIGKAAKRDIIMDTNLAAGDY